MIKPPNKVDAPTVPLSEIRRFYTWLGEQLDYYNSFVEDTEWYEGAAFSMIEVREHIEQTILKNYDI